MCSPSGTATASATSPTTKVTEPMTTALAARTRPRRGLAVSVTRIRPRRYSEVMKSVARTITAISPANAPLRVLSMVEPPNKPPLTAGAMSPEPLTMNAPADSWTPPVSKIG